MTTRKHDKTTLNTINHFFGAVLLLGSLFFVTPKSAAAATVTWTGSGNCSTDANWSGGVKPTTTDDVVLNATSTSNMTWDSGCPATINSFLMDTGYTGTVTVSKIGTITITGNMTINKGTLTHTINTTTAVSNIYKLDFLVGGNFILDTNGTINVAGMGYQDANGPGAGADYSGANASYGGGAGYGGTGGTGTSAGGTIYGSVTQPTDIGSGGGRAHTGGGSNGWYVSGGNGGGAVKINATGSMTISGTISADGGTGGAANYGGLGAAGGGSGGSVYLVTAGALSGSGTITAKGGDSSGAGGGGGRISIQSATDTSSLTKNVYGQGTAYYYGGAGTIYTKVGSANGDLLVDNNSKTYTQYVGITKFTNDLSPTSWVFDTVTVRNQGFIYVSKGGSVTATSVDFGTNGIIGEVGAINSDPAGTFNLPTNFTVPYTSGSVKGTYIADKPHTFSSLTVNGSLIHSQNTTTENYKIDLTVNGNFTLASTGTINLTGRGYQVGYGTGAGGTNYQSAQSGGGGGYGGAGGTATLSGGGSYGSIKQPINIGSSGGNGYEYSWNMGSSPGGAGGGAVKINATGAMDISGTVSVDGEQSYNYGSSFYGGSGSGGSIYLIAGSISGAGTLSANGGASGRAGGGGGRISINYGSGSTSSMTVRAYAGGASGYYGGGGTIFTKVGTANGDLLIDNNNQAIGANVGRTSLTTDNNSLTFDNLTLDKYGTLKFTTATALTTGNLTLSNNGNLENSSSASTCSILGNFNTSSGQTTGGANLTLEFSGTNSQTISQSAGTFSALVRVNKTGSNAVSLATNFVTTGASATTNVSVGKFGLNGKNFTSGGTFTIQRSGTLILQGAETYTTPTLASGCTVEYTGNGNSGANTYTLTTLTGTYSNLTVSSIDGATDIFQLGADLTITGNLTITAGTFTHNNYTVNFTSTKPATITTNGAIFHNVVFNGVDGTDDGAGGTITHSGGYTYHTFTAADTFTPPSSGVSATVYAWGGGGAGGTVGGWSYGAAGGAAGAANGTVNFLANYNYPVVIGGGGQINAATGAAGGGGAGTNNGADNRYGGGGGGYSGVFMTSVSQLNAILIAGGGGGGGSSRAGTGNAGGGGGGSSGQVGYSPYNGKSAYGGNPGTQSAAGADASSDSANGSGGQGALQGGVPRTNSYGGGGGGGYWGGSAGGYSESNTMGGGGGGSAYYNPTYVSAATLTAGSGTTVGDSANSLRGTAGDAGAVAGAGANGTLVIKYATISTVTSWTIQDSFNTDSSGTITLTDGILYTNGKTVTTSVFSSSNTNSRTIDLGASQVNLTGTGTVWDVSTNTNLTLTPGASTIIIADTGSSDKTFAGNSLVYHNLSITGGGTGKVLITGSNTFYDFTINAPKTVNLTAGTTTLILNQFYSNGTATNGITLISATNSTHTLSKSSGTVNIAYTTISYSVANGGATWNAFTTEGNLNGGNNSGWNFQAPPAARLNNGIMRFQGGGMRLITQ